MVAVEHVGEGAEDAGEGGEGGDVELEGVGFGEGGEAVADFWAEDPEGEFGDGDAVVVGGGLERALGAGEVVEEEGGELGGGAEHEGVRG